MTSKPIFFLGFLAFFVATTSISSHISKPDFYRINNLIFSHFAPLVNIETGCQIALKQSVTNIDCAFNRNNVSKFKNALTMTITSAVAFSDGMIPEGHALLVCHEMGHIFGGEPRFKKNRAKDFSSFEGIADYWGARYCMPIFLQLYHFEHDITALLTPYILDRCNDAHDEADIYGYAQCLRSMAGIKALEQYFNRQISHENSFRRKVEAKVAMEWQDPQIKAVHGNGISNQCRLDVLQAGVFKEAVPRCF